MASIPPDTGPPTASRHATTPCPPLGRRDALALAVPLMAANAVAPAAGVADTVIIGMAGSRVDLAGVALGATVFNALIAAFYFLRMSTTALAAQADGRGDRSEGRLTLARAVILGVAAGLALTAMRGLASDAAFALFQGSAPVEAQGDAYVRARLLGAPAALAVFAFSGWLIGRGRSGAVLIVHGVFSAANVALDIVFVFGLGLGAAGVAMATASADWAAAAVGAGLAWRIMRRDGPDPAGSMRWTRLFAAEAWRRLFIVNRDLMIRTLCLIAGFSWFANAAAGEGAAVLAGTHVLLQFVTVWAFVLDAYAFTAESFVGRAAGAGARAALRRAVRVTSELALGSGAVLSLATLLGGAAVLDAIVADPAARAEAERFLPYCAAIPLLGAPAWQLDGIFIGAARSVAMRNAMLASLGLYIASDLVLRTAFAAHGMWLAFTGFYVARAITLAAAYPGLEQAVAPRAHPPT